MLVVMISPDTNIFKELDQQDGWRSTNDLVNHMEEVHEV